MKTEPLSILAVDDDQGYLALLQAGLREALPEAELATATDGLQGLALARELDPDVVLLDLVMPGIDGYEVCRRLKAEDRLRDIPVLVLTAVQADRTSRLAALTAGAEGFLAKPCDEPELVAQIRVMAKIKAANRLRRLETAQLEAMVAQRTRELTLELAERKRAEDVLRKLSSRHEAILLEIPDILMEVDANRICTWANPAGLEFFGPDVLGKPANHYFVRAQDTYAKVQPLFDGDAATFYVESWQRRKDGQERLLGWWCRALKDAEGRVTGALSTARDLTERVRMEQTLNESEERFRTVFEAANVGKSMTLPGGEIRVNLAFARMLGYSLEELRGKTWQELTPAEDVPATQRVIDQLLSGERDSARFTKRYHHKNGSTLWADVSVALRRDAAGQPLHFITTVVDISERKRAEAALAAERDNLRAFLDAAPAAILVLDELEEVRHANPAAERLFGRFLAGADRRRCGDLIGCVHRGADPRSCGAGPTCPGCQLYGAVKEALAGRRVRDRELTAEIAAGAEAVRRQLVCNAAPITLEGKRGAILAVHDITDLRRAETERERLQTSLAQSDRLSSMGMLAAGVVHEINNPLSYVLYNLESLAADLPGLTEGMRRCHAELTARVGGEAATQALGAGQAFFSPAPLDDALDRLREAVSGAHRIKNIARSLGTFSRVEQSEVKPVDVQASIEHALTMASNEIKYRARVVRDFADVPPVLATEGKLAQVFLNLFINAAHAIGEGRVEQNEIRVRTWAEGGRVCVEVRDTGRGIAPEHRARIFEPFFTTKGVGVGSGLGLSICRNLILGFGGEITFSSEPGRGTRFLVELPRLPGDREQRGAEAPEQAPARPGVRGRILVVDDEAGIRASLARLLGREHEVITASSGAEAQVLLTTDRRFDLILCDLMMPRMSGMDLHVWLAQQDPALAGQVVFITGGAFTPGAAEYLARVGNLKVEKPFDNVSLRRMAGELVLAARAKRGARREG